MIATAHYFDGKTTRRHTVRLTAAGGHLWIQGEGVDRRAPRSALKISEQRNAVPRLIHLPDGAYCEAAEGEALQSVLKSLGHEESTVNRMQRSTVLALASLAIFIAAVAAAYQWGLPWAARHIAAQLPASLAQTVSDQTLEWLERSMFKPSALAPARQQELLAQWTALQRNGDRAAPAHTLLFRSSPQMGANALALPDGRIIVLDELVQLAERDEQILGVLSHELGHVAHQHGLQLMVQSAVVGGLSAWWLGDVSSLLVAAPTVLMNAHYSRQLEREADRYGAQLLKAGGIAPRVLGEMLEKLEKTHGGKSEGRDWTDYLQSHPATEERIRELEALQ